MRRTVLLFVALLALAVAGASNAKEAGKGDTLFDGLSQGNPEAREIIESLIKDTRKMLSEIRAAAKEEKPSRSRMVVRWNDAIADHSEEWNRKIARARGISRASMQKDLGGARSEIVQNAAPSWPSDWKRWGDTQFKFFAELEKSRYMEWLYDTRERIEGLEDSLDDGPKIMSGYVESLEDIGKDIRQSRDRLERATSKADVEQELRKFIRIWTATSNLERSVRAKQQRVKEFFERSDTGVDNVAKGVDEVKHWADEVQGRPMLDPMCKQAANALVGYAMVAVDDYKKQREDVLKVAKPLLEGTLFKGVKGFEGAGLSITAEVEKYEQLLQLKEASFR